MVGSLHMYMACTTYLWSVYVYVYVDDECNEYVLYVHVFTH